MSALLVSVVVVLVVAAVIRLSPDEPDQSATSVAPPVRVKPARGRRLPSGVTLLLLTVGLGAFMALLVVSGILVLMWSWRAGP